MPGKPTPARTVLPQIPDLEGRLALLERLVRELNERPRYEAGFVNVEWAGGTAFSHTVAVVVASLTAISEVVLSGQKPTSNDAYASLALNPVGNEFEVYSTSTDGNPPGGTLGRVYYVAFGV